MKQELGEILQAVRAGHGRGQDEIERALKQIVGEIRSPGVQAREKAAELGSVERVGVSGFERAGGYLGGAVQHVGLVERAR